MPQIFQVLKCYQCRVFQIHQTKKSNKFECKMCGEKQSIKRHYGIGSGKDCRLHVQHLNGLRGDNEINSTVQIDSSEECDIESKTDEEMSENINSSIVTPAKRSKWSAFLNKEENITEEVNEEPMSLRGREVVLELPLQKRKNRMFKVKTCSSSDLEEQEYVNTSTSASNAKFTGNTKGYDIRNSVNVKSENISNDVKNTNQNNINKSITHTEHLNNYHSITFDKRKSPIKRNVLKSITKNSKWAQFVREEEENEILKNEVLLSQQKHDESLSKTDNLFSLCEDNDLDNVLDI